MKKLFYLFPIILGVLGALTLSGCPQPDLATVPDLTGLTSLAAVTALTNANLNLGATAEMYHATGAIGTIVDQTPDAGAEVDLDSSVDIVLSKGVLVPDLAGLSTAAATTALTNANLSLGSTTQEFHLTVAIGAVIEQLPLAGAAVEPASSVAIVVSKGVEVPDLAGMTSAEAGTALTSASLALGATSQEFHASAPIGTVISQTPDAGQGVSNGASVDIVLSKGVEVPDLSGLLDSVAETTLTSAGLSLGATTFQFHASAAMYTVIGQSPSAGSGVASASAVDITISSGNMLRVDVNTPAGKSVQDGFTWDTAYATIQEAINQAVILGGAEVWVAGGTYDDYQQDDADGSLQLGSNVYVYGGFSHGDLLRTDRDWVENETVIDGANGRGTGQAAYHVVKGADNATLDGFTIMNGNANGAVAAQQNGGGMKNIGVSPLVQHCLFTQNTAAGNGGGMYNENLASPQVIQCTFSQNSANYGGGISNNTNCASTIINCVFYANAAGGLGNGGGIDNLNGSSPAITNCTFNANTAFYGGSIANEGDCDPVITNCIMWGNVWEIYVADVNSAPVIACCCIEAGVAGEYVTGTDITFDDPVFTNAGIGDLTLDTGSSCIDTGTGDTGTYPDVPADDILGTARPQGSTHDIGAYEAVP